jgi:hypothetical protein
MMPVLIPKAVWAKKEFDDLIEMAPDVGVFLNTHTFEVDLFKSGLEEEFAAAISTVRSSKTIAQRLASIIADSDAQACPKYIVAGVRHVADQCKQD